MDDEVKLWRTYTELLQGEDFEVMEARNGREGAEMALERMGTG